MIKCQFIIHLPTWLALYICYNFWSLLCRFTLTTNKVNLFTYIQQKLTEKRYNKNCNDAQRFFYKKKARQSSMWLFVLRQYNDLLYKEREKKKRLRWTNERKITGLYMESQKRWIYAITCYRLHRKIDFLL